LPCDRSAACQRSIWSGRSAWTGIKLKAGIKYPFTAHSCSACVFGLTVGCVRVSQSVEYGLNGTGRWSTKVPRRSSRSTVLRKPSASRFVAKYFQRCFFVPGSRYPTPNGLRRPGHFRMLAMAVSLHLAGKIAGLNTLASAGMFAGVCRATVSSC
jgi:hypothetical protein